MLDADEIERERQLGAARAKGAIQTTAQIGVFGCLAVVLLLWGAWFALKSAADGVPEMRKAAREQINRERAEKGLRAIDFENGETTPDNEAE